MTVFILTPPAGSSASAITFNDTADADGTQWFVTEEEGWDSPEMRQSFGEISGVHGRTVDESLYGGRAISLRGVAKANSVANFWKARERLAHTTEMAASPGTLRVDESTPKQISVHRSGPVKMRFLGGSSAFEFEIPLFAPKPAKVAVTETTVSLSSSPVTVTNLGTFPASPTLEVVGSSSGNPTVTRAGRSVVYNAALASGETLVIDFSKRTAKVNGVNKFDLLVPNPQWWELAPGDNSISYSGGGTRTLKFRSAWI